MCHDIDNFIHQSYSCLKERRPHILVREPLQPIVNTAAFGLTSIDFVHLETSISGYQYILVVVDHFTKFAQAFPTHETSRVQLLQIRFSVNSSLGLDSLERSLMVKVASLEVTCSRSYQC